MELTKEKNPKNYIGYSLQGTRINSSICLLRDFPVFITIFVRVSDNIQFRSNEVHKRNLKRQIRKSCTSPNKLNMFH